MALTVKSRTKYIFGEQQFRLKKIKYTTTTTSESRGRRPMLLMSTTVNVFLFARIIHCVLLTQCKLNMTQTLTKVR